MKEFLVKKSLCKSQSKKETPWQLGWPIPLFKSRLNCFVSERCLPKMFLQAFKQGRFHSSLLRYLLICLCSKSYLTCNTNSLLHQLMPIFICRHSLVSVKICNCFARIQLMMTKIVPFTDKISIW